MKNVLKLIGIITLAVIIGIGVTSCKDPADEEECTHSWNNYVETTSATCETAGIQTRTCSKCGVTDMVTKEGTPKRGHDWNYDKDETWEEIKAPTVEEEGEEIRKCQREGCKAEEKRSIEKLPFNVSIDSATSGTITFTYDGNPKSVIVSYDDHNDVPIFGNLNVWYQNLPGYTLQQQAPTNAGTYEVKVTTSGGTAEDITVAFKVGYLVIEKIQLTWNTDGTVNSKTYDRTNTATAGTHPTLNGVLPAETATIEVVNGTVTFSNVNAGESINVIAAGYGIGGTGIANYNAPVAQPVFANGVINPKPITITGVSAINRQFVLDNTIVEITGGTLTGVEVGDTVNSIVPSTGTITNANVGSDKVVSFSNITLDGAQAGNYSLTNPQPTITVNITQASGASITGTLIVASVTENTITVSGVSIAAPNTFSQMVEYGINTSNNTASATWQDGDTFTGRAAGIEYFIFARAKTTSDGNVASGIPTGSIKATILTNAIIINFGVEPDVPDNFTLSHTGSPRTVTVQLENAAEYDSGSITWQVGTSEITGTGAMFTLSLDNLAHRPVYYDIGEYFLTVRATKGGTGYSKVISFSVAF